jgi:hypothetical protein
MSYRTGAVVIVVIGKPTESRTVVVEGGAVTLNCVGWG